ncbi:MAG: preprotein translocase subunit SecE [Deltaproteobacteria bacterium]|nr:preprotein translocase subunit SecE [Deltaproteobacteria bacterium]
MFGRLYRRISDFLFEVRAEVKKVSFPTRLETIGSTGVVLVLVMLVSIFLAVIDHLLVRLVKVVLG